MAAACTTHPFLLGAWHTCTLKQWCFDGCMFCAGALWKLVHCGTWCIVGPKGGPMPNTVPAIMRVTGSKLYQANMLSETGRHTTLAVLWPHLQQWGWAGPPPRASPLEHAWAWRRHLAHEPCCTEAPRPGPPTNDIEGLRRRGKEMQGRGKQRPIQRMHPGGWMEWLNSAWGICKGGQPLRVGCPEVRNKTLQLVDSISQKPECSGYPIHTQHRLGLSAQNYFDHTLKVASCQATRKGACCQAVECIMPLP